LQLLRDALLQAGAVHWLRARPAATLERWHGEFGRLLQQVGAVGTATVNFSTGTPAEAAAFVAYMVAPASRHPSRDPAVASFWAGLRARDGHPAPYRVPYWEVGNEQDNASQFGWRSGL
jgi:alpha-N-arabinofuranosidase